MMFGNKVESKEQDYISSILTVSKATALILGGNSFGKVIFFFYTLYLTKNLGINDVGIYFLSLTIIQLLVLFANVGMNSGVTRFVAIYKGKGDIARSKGTIISSLCISAITATTVTLLIVLFGDLISSNIFNNPRISNILKIIAISIPFDCLMQNCLASTRAQKFMHCTVITENLGLPLIRFLSAILLINIFGLGLKGAALAYTVASILSACLSLYFANRHISLFSRRQPTIYDVRKLIQFSLPMVFSGFIYNLLRKIDILMIGFFLTGAEVGIYTIAVRMLVLVDIFFQAFRPILAPYAATLHDNAKIEQLSYILKFATKWSISISLPVAISLLIFPDFVLNFFGPKYVAGSYCLMILLTANFFVGVSGLSDTVLVMAGRSGLSLKNNVIVVVLNCVLNYIFIPKLGLLGAALATCISLLILSALRVAEVFYLLSIHQFNKNILESVFSGVFSAAIVIVGKYLYPVETNLSVIIFLFVLFVSYFSIIFYPYIVGNKQIFSAP